MRDLNNIEKRLFSDAQRQESPVDTASLWSSVESQLPQENKRRAFPFWMLGFVIIGALLIGLKSDFINDFFINHNDSEVSGLTYVAVESEDNKPTKVNESESLLVLNKNRENIEGSNSREGAGVAYNSHNKNRNSLLDESKENASKQIVISRSAKRNKQNSSRTSQEISNQLFAKVADQENTVIKETVTQSHALDKSNMTSRHEALVLEKKDIEIVTKSPRPYLGSQSISVLSLSYINTAPVLPPSPPYRHRMSWEDPISKWKLNVSAGYSNSLSHISLKDVDYKDHLARRLASETPLSSWHLRGNLSYFVNADWSVKAGLRFNHLYGQSRATIKTRESITLEDVVIQRIIGPEGIEEVLGSVEVMQETVSEVNRINKYKSVETELMIMRHLELELVNLSFGLGVSYGLSYDQTGYIHPSGDQEYDLFIDDNDWFKNSTGLGGILELGIQYPVSTNFNIELYGLYNHPFSSLTTINYGLTERRESYHLGVGLGYFF